MAVAAMQVDVKSIVQSADVPSVPKILNEILLMADNPMATSSALEVLVVQEPGLAAQLLKWVNSALYALPNRVSSVSHSMVLLGFSTVKSVAAGMILINAFDTTVGLTKEYVGQVWGHTLSAATFIRHLTKGQSQSVRDDLFLAALIHDVGHLVLQQYFGAEYHALCTDFPFPPPEAERAMFGTDHAEVGAALLEEWKMPQRVVDLVALHHQPQRYEGVPSVMAFLRSSLELAAHGDFQQLLTLPVDEIDADLVANLEKAGWRWSDLQQQGEAVLQALGELKQLLS